MKKTTILALLSIPFMLLAEKPVETKVDKKKVEKTEPIKAEKPTTLSCPHCTYETQNKNIFTRHLERCPKGIISMTEKRLQSKDEENKREDDPEKFFEARTPKPPSQDLTPRDEFHPSSPQDRQIKTPNSSAMEKALRN